MDVPRLGRKGHGGGGTRSLRSFEFIGRSFHKAKAYVAPLLRSRRGRKKGLVWWVTRDSGLVVKVDTRAEVSPRLHGMGSTRRRSRRYSTLEGGPSATHLCGAVHGTREQGILATGQREHLAVVPSEEDRSIVGYHRLESTAGRSRALPDVSCTFFAAC